MKDRRYRVILDRGYRPMLECLKVKSNVGLTFWRQTEVGRMADEKNHNGSGGAGKSKGKDEGSGLGEPSPLSDFESAVSSLIRVAADRRVRLGFGQASRREDCPRWAS